MSDRPTSGPRDQRLDIQALRALSVILVVVFHLWPHQVTGGYVGVDVFFVISGFLITGHLIRDAERHGAPRLSLFWSRRIRRLLPASMTVLLVTTVAIIVLVPKSYWSQYLNEVAAAALYSENWRMAFDSVDYLASTNSPSPVQHYWSLGVEEQFYLLWPLIVAFASRKGVMRLFKNDVKVALGVVLLVLFVASLVTSVLVTPRDPGIAYVGTHVRAWEFACGGLVSCVRPVPWGRLQGSLLFFLGLGMICVAGARFDETTAFPGYAAALPVLGAALCLWVPGEHTSALKRLYSIPVVQRLGDWSYAIYLWHWPLIILGPFALGGDLGQMGRGGILLLTVVLSALTKRFIEDPFRFGISEAWQRPGRAFAFALLSSSALAVGSLALVAPISKMEEQLASESAAFKSVGCEGAEVLDPARKCDSKPGELMPDPSVASLDHPQIYEDNKCRTSPIQDEVKPCTEGPKNGLRIALVGDSHAAQWHPPLTELAQKHGASVTVYFKAACPFSAETSAWTGSRKRTTCATWNAAVLKRLRREKYDMVVTSAVTTHEYVGDGVAGFAERWRQLLDIGSRVVVLADSPRMTRAELDCLQGDIQDRGKCGRPAMEAVPFDPLREAARRVTGVLFVDVVPLVCPDGWCPAAIGNVVVYRDTSSHMTRTFARSLEFFLEKQIPFTR